MPTLVPTIIPVPSTSTEFVGLLGREDAPVPLSLVKVGEAPCAFEISATSGLAGW